MDMACYLTTELKTFYTERKAFWESLLVKAELYYEHLLSSEGLESFKFDSGEAMSWAKYTDADKFLKVIGNIETQIGHYRNKLNGTGIVRLNLRRR